MSDLIQLICIICRYYIEKEPIFSTEGYNTTITISSDNTTGIENVAKHLKILGFRDISISNNTYIFSNSDN